MGEAASRATNANDERKRTRLRYFKAQERAGAEQSKRKGGRGPLRGVERLLVPAYRPRADGGFRSRI